MSPMLRSALYSAVIGALGSILIARAVAQEQFSVPPGFVVEELYTPPLAEQGSWVSLCVGPGGDLLLRINTEQSTGSPRRHPDRRPGQK